MRREVETRKTWKAMNWTTDNDVYGSVSGIVVIGKESSESEEEEEEEEEEE